MAARKTAAAKATTALVPVAAPGITPVPVNAEKLYDPDNPHTWLPLFGDPVGAPGVRILHGTLRRAFREQANSAEAFARAKLVPVASPDPLGVTALRHEVIVPAGADDIYADPWLMPRLVDHAMARDARGSAPLLCYVTVSDPDVPRLHEQWRSGRQVVERLVERFSVPMLLVQHAPERAQSGNAPHLHILAGVMALGARGFGAVVPALVNDKARQIFVDAFRGGTG